MSSSFFCFLTVANPSEDMTDTTAQHAKSQYQVVGKKCSGRTELSTRKISDAISAAEMPIGRKKIALPSVTSNPIKIRLIITQTWGKKSQ